MKQTIITQDWLLEHGFRHHLNSSDVYLMEQDPFSVRYDLTDHVVQMYKNIGTSFFSINMPCFSVEQYEFYANIIGISDYLALRNPKKFCLVVDRCVLTIDTAVNKLHWTELSALSDTHCIVFERKDNFEKFNFEPIVRNAIRQRGVLMDYNQLIENV